MVYCQPGAKVSKLVGVHDERLKVALNAPAVENRANEVLIDWMAQQLDMRRQDVHILSGQTSRRKRLLPRSISLSTVSEKLLVLLN